MANKNTDPFAKKLQSLYKKGYNKGKKSERDYQKEAEAEAHWLKWSDPNRLRQVQGPGSAMNGPGIMLGLNYGLQEKADITDEKQTPTDSFFNTLNKLHGVNRARLEAEEEEERRAAANSELDRIQGSYGTTGGNVAAKPELAFKPQEPVTSAVQKTQGPDIYRGFGDYLANLGKQKKPEEEEPQLARMMTGKTQQGPEVPQMKGGVPALPGRKRTVAEMAREQNQITAWNNAQQYREKLKGAAGYGDWETFKQNKEENKEPDNRPWYMKPIDMPTIADVRANNAAVREGQQRGLYDKNYNDLQGMSDEGLEKRVWDLRRERGDMEKRKQASDAWTLDENDAVHSVDPVFNGMMGNERGQQLLGLYGTDAAKAQEKANNFFVTDSTYNWSNTEESKAEHRAALFDSVFGEGPGSGAYLFYTDGMDPMQKYELDEQLDQIVSINRNPDEGVNFEEEIDYLNRQISETEQEQNNRRKLKEIEAGATGTFNQDAGVLQNTGSFTDAMYDGSLIPQTGIVYDADADEHVMLPNGTEIEKAYYWANNWDKIDNLKSAMVYARKEMFMSDDQLKTFNTLFKQDKLNGTNTAQAYLEALDPYLTKSLLEYRNYRARKTAETPVIGQAASLLTYPMTIVGGFAGTGGSIATLFGNKAAQDATAPIYMTTNWVNTVRDERSNEFADWAVGVFGEGARQYAKQLRQLVYSMGDNLMAMGVAGAKGGEGYRKSAQYLVQIIMSSEVTSSKMAESLEQGMNPTEAALRAIGSGMIEAATEKWSLEALLKPDVRGMLGKGRQIWGFIGKSAAAEGSEELASNVGNIVWDKIMSYAYGHKDELTARYDELRNEGYGDTEASNMVLMEKLDEMGWDFAGGAVSGGIFAGGRTGMTRYQNRQIGAQVNKANNNGGNAGNTVVEQALKMDPESQAHRLAEGIRTEQEKTGKINNTKLGNLMQVIQMDAAERSDTARTDQIRKNALEQLDQLEIDAATRDQTADAIVNAVEQGGIENLSNKERGLLTQNQDALKVYYDITHNQETISKINNQIAAETQSEREALNAVRMAAEEANQNKNQQEERPESLKNSIATEDEIAEAEKDGAVRVGGQNEALVDGQFGRVVGLEMRSNEQAEIGQAIDEQAQQVEETEDAEEEPGKAKLKIGVEVNGETRWVDPAAVKSLKTSTAAIIQNAQTMSGIYSPAFATQMIQANESGKINNVGSFLLNATQIRMAAYMGESMPAVTMDQELAKQLWQSSVTESRQQRMDDLKNRRSFRGQGKGTAVFNGATFGTEAWNKELAKYDQKTQDQMNLAAGFAKASGLDLRFTTTEELTKQFKRLRMSKDASVTHGFEQAGQGVTININAQTSTGSGITKQMMVTFGHEFTHWLQDNSYQGYNQLQRFVFDTLKKNGVNLSQEIMDRVMGKKLDIHTAMSEVVAEACDQIFNSESLMEQIKSERPGVYANIQKFVKDVVSKVKSAIRGMRAQSSSLSIEMMRSTNELAKVWLGAYDEAISGAITEQQVRELEEQLKTEPGKVVEQVSRFSSGVLDNTYMAALKDKNTDLMQLVVDEAARRKGYDVVDAFHGTDDFGFTEFDLEKGQQTIFVAYDIHTAGTYTDSKQVKTISEADVRKMTNDQLLEMGKKIFQDTGLIVRNAVYHEDTDTFEYETTQSMMANAQTETQEMSRNDMIEEMDAIMKEIRETPARKRSRIENEIAGGIYRLYTMPDHQLVVDAKGEKWNNIKVDFDEMLTQYGMDVMTTREIAQWAKAKGYTSVRINNVHDQGKNKAWGDKATGDIGIFFYQAQTKSADPVTYDDNGNVIKPSERFNVKKGDMRWSSGESGYDDVDKHIIYQINANLDAINKMDPVSEISSKIDLKPYYDRGARSDDAALKMYANEIADKIGRKVYREGFGEVNLSKKRISVGLGYRMNNAQRASFAAVPDVIRFGMEINNHQNHKDGNAESFTFAAPIMLDGEKKLMAVVVRYSYNEHRYKTHKVFLTDGSVMTFENEKTEVGNAPGAIASQEPIHSVSDNNVSQNESIVNMDNARMSYGDNTEDELREKYRQAGEYARTLRNQLRELTKGEEYTALTEELYAAPAEKQNEVLERIRMWEKDNHIAELTEKLKQAEQKAKDADQAFSKYIEERELAEEKKNIEASGLSEQDWRRKQAVKEYGYTTNYNEAGYLLPDGKMLNFTGEKGKHYGHRGQDHRNISTLYANKQGAEAMVDFMAGGNIRVMAESPGIDISTEAKPTNQQYNAIRKMVQQFADDEYFSVDLTDADGRTIGTLEYEGTIRPDRVLNDIKNYFDTGKVPQQSTVDQFHFSSGEDNGNGSDGGDGITGMDVNEWLLTTLESDLWTEGEKRMLRAFRDLKANIGIAMFRERDYRALLKQIQQGDTKSADTQAEIRALEKKIQEQIDLQKEMIEKRDKITDAEGYGGMMYRMQQVLKQFKYGQTQDQIDAELNKMMAEVGQMQKELAASREQLRKLAESQAVQTMKSYLGKTDLSRAASILRKSLGSTMNKTELENRLAAMSLKLAAGENIMDEAAELAEDLVNQVRGIGSEALERIKGTTFVIGPEQLKELRALNITMADIRSQLRGSGIKVKAGKVSTIEAQWEDFRENDQGLPDLGHEKEQILNLAAWAQEQVRMNRGGDEFRGNIASITADVAAMAGTVSQNIVQDPAAKKQIRSLMNDIKAMAQQAEDAAAVMDKMDQRFQQILAAGKTTSGWVGSLKTDIYSAVDYFNKMSRYAQREERAKIKKTIIDQLKSENGKKLLAKELEWRERMQKDKKTREMVADNAHVKHQIETTVKRISRLMTEETDLKNIPEPVKPLARKLVGLIVEHDNRAGRGMKIAQTDKKSRARITELLEKWKAQDGDFNPASDLEFLVAGEGEYRDETVRDAAAQAMMDVETGLLEYDRSQGQGMVTLKDWNNALQKIRDGVATLNGIIQAYRTVEIEGRRVMITDIAADVVADMKDSRHKARAAGNQKVDQVRDAMDEIFLHGEATPVYFIKNLRNHAISQLWNGMKSAENDNGLDVKEYQEKLAGIFEKHGYSQWDPKQTFDIELASGKKITMNLENLMYLMATYKRESNTARTEQSMHLTNGGIYLEDAEEVKVDGQIKKKEAAIRLKESDIKKMMGLLSEEQKAYVDDMVQLLSTDVAEMGNKASMQMFGIKKFKESYYFPFDVWSGVKAVKSNAGSKTNNDHRLAHPGFSNRTVNNAQNAIVIGNFTETVAGHIVGMINYSTMAPAIENIQKVLNTQLEVGEGDEMTKRNVYAAFQEAYGKQATKYMKDLMQDLNGGAVRDNTKTIEDVLLRLFKKNAVAGSLSVAAQQPMSYIRAALRISPKYLAQAINPKYYKGSWAEMMKYSGVAVIKDIGKFDMGLGKSAVEYMLPDERLTRGKRIWNKIGEVTTILPEKMDAMTWTRMWSACKLEMMDQNPNMDHSSPEFMRKVAERFNDLMRETQVYDSVMVRSRNMRSQNVAMKTATSFMAEPTLTANVLADAWLNRDQEGGKRNVALTAANFALSAILQAAIKAGFGTGRSPDKKKTMAENFLQKFTYSLMSELNPLSLLPYYSDVVETLTDGEHKDDTFGVLGKIKTIKDNLVKVISGESDSTYRMVEDSVGQLLQLITNVPVKNIMRDLRATANMMTGGHLSHIFGGGFADRDTNLNVIKYSMLDEVMKNDLPGLVNSWLDKAGYKSTNDAYYERMYQAKKAGNTGKASGIFDYLTKGRGLSEKTVQSEMEKRAKKDESLSTEEKLEYLPEGKEASGYVMDQYREGKISRAEAEKLYRQGNPDADEDTVWWELDRADWEKETGNKETGKYYRLYSAMDENKSEKIQTAVKGMTEHGVEPKNIRKTLTTKYKASYLAATGDEKRRMKDALIKAYKATGMTAEEAEKQINGWKEKKSGK